MGNKGRHWKSSEEIILARKGRPGNNKGKHWKIKDTSNMGHTAWNKGTKGVMKANSGSFRKGGRCPNLGKKWKIKGISKNRGAIPHNKGKTNVELYGEEKAEQLRKLNIQNHLGKITYKRTPSINKKSRLSAIKYLKENIGFICPRIGKNETKILDKKEKELNIKIIRQYHIKNLGYWADGYCKEKNMVFEIYEPFHYINKNWKEEKLNEKTKQREEDIINAGYKFLRINEQKILKLIK